MKPLISTLFTCLVVPAVATAYDSVDECKEQFRIIRHGTAQPLEQSDNVCVCAFERTDNNPPSSADLVQCMHKLRVEDGRRIWCDGV